jgi:hypothetical protein
MVARCLIVGCAVLLSIPPTGLAQQTTPEAPAPADAPVRKNYFVPFFDIAAFDFLLNRYGHAFVDRTTYDVDIASIKRNLRSPWVLDNDPFSINQFMHPYQGSMYHGFARSAGLNYWESLGYTFTASILWEIAGETTLPSRNDQMTTGIGGSFLGEALFRLASLVLEQSNYRPRFLRELSAAVISPSTGFNRLAYGRRFRGAFPSREPALFTRVQFGMMGTSSVRKSLTQSVTRNEAVADFSVDYGMPGKSSYAYRRPFDYFNFQFTSSTGSRFESILSRGLLAGRAYGGGENHSSGVWGLYGTYDYVAPQIFRVSSTALALGATAQRRIAESRVLQSTLLAGVGWGAGGTIRGAAERDYHYGLTPQLLAAVRFVPSDKTAFDLTFRDYYVSRIASKQLRGSENIAHAEALFSVRVRGGHAASVKYAWSRRAAAEPDLGDTIQSRGTVGLFYTYLGGTPSP